MSIIERIEKLRKERKWTVYELSMEAGITQSTLASMLQRNTPPRIETLQAICEAFGITLAQFFLEDEEIEIVSAKEKELLAAYRKLPENKQKALLHLIEN